MYLQVFELVELFQQFFRQLHSDQVLSVFFTRRNTGVQFDWIFLLASLFAQ